MEDYEKGWSEFYIVPLEERISKLESAIREFYQAVDEDKTIDSGWMYFISRKYSHKFKQLLGGGRWSCLKR